VSLNDATKDCGGDWSTEGCLKAYKEYVDKNEKAIEKGTRFSISGEYVDADGETIDTEIQGINPIVSKSARKLVLSLGWSRKLNFSDSEPIKLDLVASYESVSDDPKRQDRGVATLTFTRKVGDMEIPFGIVYANHSEFLGDVDSRLSAHLGIRFKMSGKKDGQ
jgi:hypothetical protein